MQFATPPLKRHGRKGFARTVVANGHTTREYVQRRAKNAEIAQKQTILREYVDLRLRWREASSKIVDDGKDVMKRNLFGHSMSRTMTMNQVTQTIIVMQSTIQRQKILTQR